MFANNQTNSTRGGARKGAGRKPGSATTKTREIANKAAAEGISPLEYMLTVLRDEGNDMAARFEAAKSAAPYLHPRLNAVAVTGAEGGPIETVSRIELVAASGNRKA